MAFFQRWFRRPPERRSYEQCVAWLRVLMSTPIRPSINTLAEPWTFVPPCSSADVAAFERTHGIELPREYVRFVTEVGNGTTCTLAVLPLGMTAQDDGSAPNIPFTPLVQDALHRPFQHGLATWSGGDFEEEIESYVEDHGKRPPTFDAEVMAGCIPISSEGCGQWRYLTVNGSEAGQVFEWADNWLSPVPTPWLRPVSFMEWIVGEVARQRGLLGEFRELTGVTPS